MPMVWLVWVDFLRLDRKIIPACYFCHYRFGAVTYHFVGKYASTVLGNKNNVILQQKLCVILGFVLHSFYIDDIN